MRKLSILAVLGGLTLAACAPTGNGDSVSTPPPGEGADQCRAAQYQRYVGRNRSELPRQPDGERWRVTCTTCPVTMDYSPGRLNILYDEQTGIIRQVKCG